MEHVLAGMRETLARFRVEPFDDLVLRAVAVRRRRRRGSTRSLDALEQLGQTYRAEDALWLRTTDFGDDKDRVLVKSDGALTYLTPDIAYHQDKRERGFDRLIDVWGADHHGYVRAREGRLRSARRRPGRASSC